MVELAKTRCTDSDMTNNTWIAPGINVALSLNISEVNAATLKQFVPILNDYCTANRLIKELKHSLHTQTVFRKRSRGATPSFANADGRGDLVC